MGQITNMSDTNKVEAVNPPDGHEIGWSIVKPKASGTQPVRGARLGGAGCVHVLRGPPSSTLTAPMRLWSSAFRTALRTSRP